MPLRERIYSRGGYSDARTPAGCTIFFATNWQRAYAWHPLGDVRAALERLLACGARLSRDLGHYDEQGLA